ncbi:Adenosylmethionine-8-amino-7-oxononanoate aminotransferase [Micractinium conductrix]|uniref:Adenosylmethionine-8-amino-7-oxononanoate aminotransferase n=1 Tax=Micractinium conductrix TaxID=554055 RepID=A0A2P6V216_9CHLO|nr:Adenosylmethionine-8-amino-7-oxononanoate aminotransferase [Micractinium conductrix]|eukprot:PSC68136.1 Adenosylmethionine-8-amino-7-oxononanoate aminotransferase [Micractinium conductrix]
MPDDDLQVDACTITKFLRTMEANQLLMGQARGRGRRGGGCALGSLSLLIGQASRARMSLCRAKGTRVAWKHLFQQEGAALRFMPFVEIMAPALRFDLFQSVITATLANSFTGHGLDTLWPWLLRYPRNSVAVVDAICMGIKEKDAVPAESLLDMQSFQGLKPG